jgi:L,D-peptidoglycan transpeptidase YkuD (ErfK/YbiS/YcfS/YnhG family)
MLLSRRQMIASASMAMAHAAIAAPGAGNLVVSRTGQARIGSEVFRCALGRSGIRGVKREGDGATPRGLWSLRQVLYRSDRITAPRSHLPVRALRPDDGWCDAPADRRYNRNIVMPYPASAERLWRADSLYDLIVVVGYNDAPVVPGAGSAIFLHVARPNYAPTAGCIAFSLQDLRRILSIMDPATRLDTRG